MSAATIMTITGIRPDFIRMSEIFKKLDNNFKHILVHSGQHFDTNLSDVFFKDLDIRQPDFNLGVGKPGAAHYEQQAALTLKIMKLLKKEKLAPDLIIFLGDSNSVLASVPLKKEGYKIAHIEAGMRSYDMNMLEEINRKVCDHVSDLLFVYHEDYKQQAMAEGIAEDKIHVVGNTIVEVVRKYPYSRPKDSRYKHIVMDIHRPENFNNKTRLQSIINIANLYATKFDLPIKMLYFHQTTKALNKFKLNLGSIEIVPLMGYLEFLQFQADAQFIYSDSGTAQEEPALINVPVVVPRDFTERPQSVAAGNSFLQKLSNPNSYQDSIDFLMSKLFSSAPLDYTWLGDGTTSEKIIDILQDYFSDT